jgi:hypothetical protein
MIFRRIPLIAAAIGLTLFFAAPLALADQHASFVAPADDDVSSQVNRLPHELAEPRRVAGGLVVVSDASTAMAPQDVPPIADSALTHVAPAPPAAPAVPVQNADGSWNLQPLLDGFIKFVGGVLGLVGAWLLSKLSDPLAKYIGIHVDAKEVAKDIGLEDQATNAVRNIIGIVEQRTGWSPEALQNVELKNVFLQMAAPLLFKQYPEIWTWLENQKGNALEWMEGKLDAAAKPAPLTIDQAKGLIAGVPAAKPATG